MTVPATGALPHHHPLAHLRAMVAVADAGTIAGGAARMHKAPAAVARSIATIEAGFAASLFERSSRGVRPNAKGALVIARGRRIAAEMQAGADDYVRQSPAAVRLSPRGVLDTLLQGRKLDLLVAIADARTVSAAAPTLAMTQAGASMALSRLEAALGQPLFSRRAEGMTPTDAGERLVLRGRRVQAELRHLASDLASLEGPPQGIVVVGTTHLGRTHYFPAAIAATVARRPGIRVRAVESSYDQLAGQLRSGEIDMLFGLLRHDHRGHGLVGERLFTDRMGVVANARHPLARRERIGLADVLGEKWILPRPGGPGKDQFDACFRRAGLAPPVASVETGDLATLRQLLEAGDMLAVTSPQQLLFEIEAGLLAELALPLADTSVEVGLMTREGAMLSPAADAVLDAVRERVASAGRPLASA